MVLWSMQWPQSLSKLNPWTHGPLSDLVDSTVSMNNFSGLLFWPLGYVIIMVQVAGVQSYDEDQIPDPIEFGSWMPVIVIHQLSTE